MYLHDFGTEAITTHPYTVTPGTFNSSFSNSSWTNSTSAWISYGGSSGQAISLSNSSGTPTITLTFSIAEGKEVEITSFNFWTRRSSTGAQNWSMKINEITVGSGTVPTSGSAIGITNVSSPINGVTGTVTVTIALSGATGTGTFRLDDFTLSGNVTETTPEPTTQSSDISFATVTTNSFTINWTSGTGDSRIVLMKKGGAVDGVPSDGSSYTANSAFGSGEEIGDSNFVVYSGSGSTVDVTGLSHSTTYHVSIFEFNGSGATSNYLTTSPPTGSQATDVPSEPTLTINHDGLTEANLDGAEISLSLTNDIFKDATLLNGSFNLNNEPSGVTVFSVAYVDANHATLTLEYDGTDFDANITDFNITIAGDELSSTNDLTSNDLSITATVETVPTVTTNETITTRSTTTASWGGNVSADGGESVAQKGLCWNTSTEPTIANSITEEGAGTGAITGNMTSLTANTEYFVRAYATNSVGTAYGSEYSFYTLADEPTTSATDAVFSDVASTTLTLSWTSGNGSDRIVLMKSGGAVDSDPVDGTTYTANAAFISGTQIGTGNYVVYKGSGSTVDITNLTQGVAYHVAIYEFNGSGTSENYKTSTPATGNETTTIPPSVLLLEENFDFTGNLTDNGWTAHSGGVTEPINTTTGLSYAGYPNSGIGNAALLDNNGQDVNKALSSVQNSGILYISFLVNVVSIADDYFLNLIESGTNYAARVFIQNSSGNLRFGLSNTSPGVYGTTDFVIGTTYLCVLKYEINTTGKCSLWVFSSGVPANEAAAGAPLVFTSGSGKASISSVALRQYNSSQNIIVDGIRVSTGWAEAPLPVELTSFTGSVAGNSVTLDWQTATEVNNYGFEVEKSANITGASSDAAKWETIAFIPGHGNSNSTKYYSYTDENAGTGNIQYRLKQIDTDGAFEYSDVVTVSLEESIPTEFALLQNYPNPFNPSTRITVNIPQEADVRLNVFNIIGEKVAELVNQRMQAGSHEFVFEASNLQSGIYIYELKAGNYSAIKKMMLIK